MPSGFKKRIAVYVFSNKPIKTDDPRNMPSHLWLNGNNLFTSSLEVIKLFSYSTQLSTRFILLINVKMQTLVGILAFISRINTV